MIICLKRGADHLHMVHHLLPHFNPGWFYLSGTGLPLVNVGQLLVADVGHGFVTCDDLKKVFALTAPRMPQHGIETAFR